MAARIDRAAEKSAQSPNIVPATQIDSQTPQQDLIEQIINASCRIEGRDEEILRWEVIEELARRVREARAPQPTSNQTQKDLAEVKESLKRIEVTQKQQTATLTGLCPTVARGSWASVAAAGSAQAPRAAPDRTTPPLRKTRELLIRILNKEEAQRTQAKPIEQILRTISEKSPTQREQIVSIRRLPSGDLALHAASSEARLELEKQAVWAKGIAPSAKVVRKTYAVLAHGIRTSLDIENAEAAITRLQKENERLHPGLEILRLAWPKKVMGSGKAYSSLIVEVAEEAMANRLLEQGILEGYSECACEYFEKKCRTMQCFQCFGFGHIGRGCKKVPACHKCGQKHRVEDCRVNDDRAHCTNCKKDGHKPWHRTCPHWVREKKIAGEILKARPYRYNEPARERTTPSQSSHFTRTSSSNPTSSEQLEDGDGFITINGGKRRKTGVPTDPKRGRPPGSTNVNRAKAAGAANASQQKITFPSST